MIGKSPIHIPINLEGQISSHGGMMFSFSLANFNYVASLCATGFATIVKHGYTSPTLLPPGVLLDCTHLLDEMINAFNSNGFPRNINGQRVVKRLLKSSVGEAELLKSFKDLVEKVKVPQTLSADEVKVAKKAVSFFKEVAQAAEVERTYCRQMGLQDHDFVVH